MQQGDFLHGFDVTRVRPCQELAATAYELRHRKTGAKLLWLSRDEQNKTFCAAFKTIPSDDTGVFHILEHSVLCGSANYPVKEPFLDLLKSSMSTFLNAMTFPDKTIYPVSSRNETDFFNLADVYLDAVFAPSIYTNPNIFRQEGWHYDLHNGADAPIFNGVVLNEMKGALSSVDEMIETEMSRLLFPNSCYRFNYGGDPRHIPDLTYEQFLNNHRKFYHPSNALFFLDGDLPIERMLEKIDSKYLSRYESNPPDFEVVPQLPAAAGGTQFYEVAPNELMDNRAQFTMGAIVCNWEEKERQYALRALCDVLAGSNEAPLKKVILKKELGQDLKLRLMDDVAQPWLCLTVQNTDAAKFDEIRTTITETLSSLAEHGLDRDAVRASLRQLEFSILDVEEPRGVEMAIASLSSWLYGGDPLLYLQNRECFASLRARVDTGYFEQILRESLLDSTRIVTLHTLPSPDVGEKRRQDEAARLAATQKAWTPEIQSDILRQTRELERWQQTADTPAQTAALPKLHLSDLPSQPPEVLDSRLSACGGAIILLHPCQTGGIVHLSLYFSIADLAAEDYPAVSLLSELIGKLPTARHSAEAIQQEIKTHIGKLSCKIMAFHEAGFAPEVCKPYFVLQCSILESECSNALPLLHEILLETDFDSTGHIYDILLQVEEAGREKLIANGHTIGMLRGMSHLSAAGIVRENTEGYSYYAKAGRLRRDFDGQKSAYAAWAKQFQQAHFTAANLTFSATGNFSEEQANEFSEKFAQGRKLSGETACYTPVKPVPEGIVISADVSYAVLCADLSACGGRFSGTWNVLANILSYDYLWNAVRVQGGAYGTGFIVSRDDLCAFYSYRDPNGKKTLDVYRKTSQFIQRFCSDSPNLERYIIGAAGAADPLLSAKARGEAADRNYFTKISYADRLQTHREMLSATSRDLAALSSVMEQAAAHNSVCVVGADSELSAASLLVLKP